MPANKRRRGRPNNNEDNARESLILAAQQCFASQPYANVTTRVVAEKAGVNAALIRYYFINKEGLYQQMLASVAEAFQNSVKALVEQKTDSPFEAIMLAHQAMIHTNPDIPKLIFKELAFNEGQSRQLVIDTVAKPNRQFILTLFGGIFKSLSLRDDVDPSILMFSVLSMSLMPALLKDALEIVEGQAMDENRIHAMIKQNSQMIQRGCFEGAE